MTRLRRSGTLGAPARDFKISKPMTAFAARHSPGSGTIRHHIGAKTPSKPGESH
jgi:hypothetical protein